MKEEHSLTLWRAVVGWKVEAARALLTTGKILDATPEQPSNPCRGLETERQDARRCPMTTNLRLSLTILSAGFAFEGAGEVYSLLTTRAFLPGTSLLFLLPAVVTLLGMLFILIGRHEWDELHRTRVRHAHLLFGLSLLAGLVAGTVVAALAAYPGLGAPLWAKVVFGAAAGAFLWGTFVVYARLVFHLVTRPSKIALAASAVWALVVSILIALTLAHDLPSILGTIRAHSPSLDYLISPVDYLASFLFVSYFLLLGAYVDAHIAVARGREASVGGSSSSARSAEPPRVSPEGGSSALATSVGVPAAGGQDSLVPQVPPSDPPVRPGGSGLG